MTRTTPPRPVDVAAVFPELAGLTRTATRLHPRPGKPTVHDSSVGGPLLWPAGEPWPTCASDHWMHELTTMEDVRTRRRILVEGWRRTAPKGDYLTPQERAVIDRIAAGHDPQGLTGEPLPMIPVAQLYARDVPDLPCPDGTDLLQVLWCPFPELESSSSALHLRWRRAANVTDVLEHPPEPAFVGFGHYVPYPCLLHPEQVVEYPSGPELDHEQLKRFYYWAKERQLSYSGDLSIAPGWKVGGWPAPWTFCGPPEPDELRCEECGAPVEALLTIDSSEWDGASGSWRPLEDRDDPNRSPYPLPHEPTMVIIGRAYTLQIYRCTASPDHLPLTIMQ